jgi:serine/threonine protein kinase
MRSSDLHDLDVESPPFDQFTSIQPLAANAGGRGRSSHSRHYLYSARDKRSRTGALIKLTAKPGLIYQQNLTNEIATLSAINRLLPDARWFPFLTDQGSLRDGRVFLIMTLFDELPLAAAIPPERMPNRIVSHLMTTIEIARALGRLHDLEIYHVDLNPMNVLYRSERGRPVIRIVDFESSYQRSRHGTEPLHTPPTTASYSAPEIARQVPDGRSDLFSLGAVLYTMLAGFQWTWEADAHQCIRADQDLDPDLKTILLTAVDPDPDRRYQSVHQFQGILAAYLEQIWPGRSWQA